MQDLPKLLDGLISSHHAVPQQPLPPKTQAELLEVLLPAHLGCNALEPPDRAKTVEQLVGYILSEEGRLRRLSKLAAPLPESQSELLRVGWGAFPSQPISLSAPPQPKEVTCSNELVAALKPLLSKPGGSQRVAANASGQVKKLGGKFFSRWNVRHLVLAPSELQWYKTEAQATRLASNGKSLRLAQVRTIELSTTENNLAVFTLHLLAGEALKFAAATPVLAETWRSRIATRCLVDAVVTGSSALLDRMQHMIDECGADVNAETPNGPLLQCTLMQQQWTAAELLLSRGADAALMLRLDVVGGAITPQCVMGLLESSGRDLNQVANDSRLGEEGGWGLLHHLVVRRDAASIQHLLQRIDAPTVRLESANGETALSLALTRLPADKTDAAAVDTVVSIVAMLLKHGADPNHLVHGDAAIHAVCKRPSLARAQQLVLECPNVDLNLCDAHGDAALHLALKTNQLALAKLVAQDSRCNMNLRDGRGESPLVIAMRLGQQEFACTLLALGADGDKASGLRSESIKQRGGSKAVQEHIKTGERLSAMPLVTTLSSAAAPASSPTTTPTPTTLEDAAPTDALDRPMHLAVKLHMAQLALKLVPLVDGAVPDGRGRTALHSAILHGLLNVALAIVQRAAATPSGKNGLDAADTLTGDTALHLAVRCGRVELALALLDAGANACTQNATGETPLHACVRLVQRMQTCAPWGARCALFLLQALLDRGAAEAALTTLPVAGVAAALRNGAKLAAQASCDCAGAQTALHWAVASAHADSLKAAEAMLRANKALLGAHDGAGLCATATALDLGHESVAVRLLAFKADGDLDYGMGVHDETLLHVAARHGLAAAANELIRRGAYVSKWDAMGLTPAHAAVAAGKGAVLEALALTAVDANARNEQGAPLLHFSIHHCSLPAVKRLVALGADVRAAESSTRFGPLERALEVEDDCVRSGVAAFLLGALPHRKEARETTARTKLARAVALTKEPEMPPPPVPATPPSSLSSATAHASSTILKKTLSASSKRSQVEALTASSPAAIRQPASRNELLHAVELEAKNTADAFIKTDAGKRVLQRKAKELSQTWASEEDSLSVEAALEFAKREFVNAAVNSAVREFHEAEAALETTG